MAFSFETILKTIKGNGAKQPDRVVGIDIGSASIKVVELEKAEQVITLRTYGELQLGPYADASLGSAVKLSEEQKIEALVDVIREAGVQATSGILSMPLSSSFVTIIPVKTAGNETLETKIPVEARKYIPVPLNEVTLDWSELVKHEGDASPSTEVLLAAIQNDSLHSYTKIMAALSMTSQPSEIEVFGSIRSLVTAEADCLAIIDIGATLSKLYIIRDGALERIHRVSTGGAAITDKLATLLQVPFVEAENIKRLAAADSAHHTEIKKVTTALLRPAFQEFSRIMQQYEARMNMPIAATQLVGGAALGVGVRALATEVIGREVVQGRPFDKVAYPAFMEDTLESLGPVFATSLGAALRPFQ